MLDHKPQERAGAGDRARNGDKLDSWKEIAAFLGREVRTAQRWEKQEGLPVHRHHHDKLGTVYAYRSELEGWLKQRQQQPAEQIKATAPIAADFSIAVAELTESTCPGSPKPGLRSAVVVAVLALPIIALAVAYIISVKLVRRPNVAPGVTVAVLPLQNL